MDLISPNLKLPYLAPAQAQKHVTHNEALRQLDAIVQLSVLGVTDTPPVTAKNGDRLIIGDAPQDIFIGHAQEIAGYQDGAWIFFVPKTGWRAYVEDAAKLQVFDGAGWQAVSSGSGSGSIETTDKLGINTAADTINRLSVKSPNTLLDNEGAGHQLKINKAAETDTASLLYQSGYMGHAEMGLTGDQDFHIKTSGDGTTFNESLIADAQTGSVSFPNGTCPETMTTPTDSAGGPHDFYGLPSVSALYYGRNTLSLTKDRVYFSPFYVDRPTLFKGGFIAQSQASSIAGAILRAGLYRLGEASGNDWSIGERIVDLGTHAADTAGHKDFVLSTPITLEPGWYVSAIGTNGSSVQVKYARTLQCGAAYLSKSGSGTSVDIRFSGASNYLYKAGSETEIVSGLSSQWPTNPVVDSVSGNAFGYMFFIPKWERWS